VVPQSQVFAGDRVDGRQSEATGGEHHGLVGAVAVQLARQAQRSGDAGERVTHPHPVHLDRALPNPLDHQRDCSGVGVPVGERERDQLALGPAEDPDELARPGGPRHQRGVDGELHDAPGEFHLLHDACLGSREPGVGVRGTDPLADLVLVEGCGVRDLPGGGLAVACGADGGGAAAGGVATGVHALQGGLLRALPHGDVAPPGGLEIGLGVLDDRV